MRCQPRKQHAVLHENQLLLLVRLYPLQYFIKSIVGGAHPDGTLHMVQNQHVAVVVVQTQDKLQAVIWLADSAYCMAASKRDLQVLGQLSAAMNLSWGTIHPADSSAHASWTDHSCRRPRTGA